MGIAIVSMNTLTAPQLRAAAVLLAEALPLGWRTPEEAMEELEKGRRDGATLLAALEGEQVVGWGGVGSPSYGGNVLELHPLAVRADRRGRGIGAALLKALEEEARRRGALTLYLGSDDEGEEGETSLAGADLYHDLPGKLRDFQPGTHPAAFYLKAGFRLIGVMPDANGPGKPDLFFAKSLR